MELKFESEYYVYTQTYKGVWTMDDKFLKEVEEYLEGYEIVREEDILEAINETISETDHYKHFINPKDMDTLDYLDDVEISNPKELVRFFGKLLKDVTCCNKAPYGANFCPTCGKKIKK